MLTERPPIADRHPGAGTLAPLPCGSALGRAERTGASMTVAMCATGSTLPWSPSVPVICMEQPGLAEPTGSAPVARTLADEPRRAYVRIGWSMALTAAGRAVRRSASGG